MLESYLIRSRQRQQALQQQQQQQHLTDSSPMLEPRSRRSTSVASPISRASPAHHNGRSSNAAAAVRRQVKINFLFQ